MPYPDIDSYLAATAPEQRAILAEIRARVHAALPLAQETISYQMPAFKLRRVFFYFAGFKKHIGIYPPVRHDADLIAELRDYRNAKGNLQFPLQSEMPYELITRVAVALSKEIA